MATAVSARLGVRMTPDGLPLTFDKPRSLSPEVLAKIKAEVVRIGMNGTRQGFKFAEKMFERYPELRGA
jgi:hypothetical protein